MIRDVDPKAFNLYLEGQRLFSVIERRHLEAAAEKFRQATKKSPKFARAWGHLAYCLAQIAVAGHAAEDEQTTLLAEAEKHAKLAVKLDRDDYANRWDLAFVLLNQGKHEASLKEYEHALDLFDNKTDKLDRRNDLLVEMAEAYVYAGNTARAFELLDRAVRIPDWYRWIRAWACFNARDYDGAVAQIYAMHKPVSDPNYVPDIQLLLAASHAHAGRHDLARGALTRMQGRRRDWTMRRESGRNPFANDKDREHWEEAMKNAGFI